VAHKKFLVINLNAHKNNGADQKPATCSVSPGFQERRELFVGLLRRKTLGSLSRVNGKLIPHSGATRNLKLCPDSYRDEL
jgi:hypothetical protein